jgi:hypothetical protein
MTGSACAALGFKARFAREAAPERLYRLHPDGQRLIRGWLVRAKGGSKHRQAVFESFIFAWIAFNAWASSISRLDPDWSWLSAVALNEEIADWFASNVANASSPLALDAPQFSKFWPIFEVQKLPPGALQVQAERRKRGQVTEQYLRHGAEAFQPQCWLSHRQAGEEVPVDWPHTLAALYRVRCNLFHGEKARHSEMDRGILGASLKVLLAVEDAWLR